MALSSSDLTTDPIQNSVPIAGPRGELAQPAHLEQLERLQKKLYAVGEHAWCYVGNGLSNQTFINAPDGVISIDSGESVEEMRDALKALRQVCKKPVVACIYSHFHYVNRTQALLEENNSTDLCIYGHAGIDENLARFGGEVAPRSNRGLIHQFGIMLPDSGADALSHCGLGLFYRNPEHAPFTPGYIPAQVTFDQEIQTEIAGLQTVMTPAPSDATDSITIWFPELKLCVNNLIWPALFNIYAIRGEEYRDPRILLRGIDHIYELEPDALIGTHGPPLEGGVVMPALLDYRDAIQFIWDQTVRWTNRGLTLTEIVAAIRLAERFNRTYLTQQFYGVVEHHTRQIHGGLFGWFDEDESQLFPLPAPERNGRLINGFWGTDRVREQRDQALVDKDFRWAAELGSWLVRCAEPDLEDRLALATVLRGMAQHTPAANIRNWCLTRALELEGTIDLSRHRTHRFNLKQVAGMPAAKSVAILRVLLDQDRAANIEGELRWQFVDGTVCGLTLRGPVAVPSSGANAQASISLSQETWASILAAKINFWDVVEQGVVALDADTDLIRTILQTFDLPALQHT